MRDNNYVDSPSLHPDQHEAIAALLETRTRFLVVGGFAFSAHAFIRGTKDIDFWVEPSLDNAARLWDALRRFGAPLNDHGVTLDDFTTPGAIYQLGLPPVRIDFITSLGDMNFSAAWRRRIEVNMEGMTVPYLGLDDLIESKKIAGRGQDLLDLEALHRVKQRQQQKKDSP